MANRTWRSRAKRRCSNVTVGKWRQRFTTGRVDALYDEPKPGAPRTLSDADVESILVATLESQAEGCGPTGAPARWRSALASVNSTVGRIWRTFGLQPHVVESFKNLRRPAVHREGAGHCRPLPESTRPRRCLVIRRKASDSSPRASAADRRWTWVGPNARRTTTSAMGTVDLFAALNVATGQVVAQVTKKQHAVEGFRAAFCARSTSGWTPPSAVHVILDNLLGA